MICMNHLPSLTDQNLFCFRSVLAIGAGEWDGKIVNADNPVRRDTALLPANGHMVRNANLVLISLESELYLMMLF